MNTSNAQYAQYAQYTTRVKAEDKSERDYEREKDFRKNEVHEIM